MDEVGIKYEVMELDKTPDGPAIQDIMLSMTGGRSVPRVFINGNFIGGGENLFMSFFIIILSSYIRLYYVPRLENEPMAKTPSLGRR
jgi:hypothetical protein